MLRDCHLSVRFESGALAGTPVLVVEPARGPRIEHPMVAEPRGPFAARLAVPPGPVRYHLALQGQRFTDPDNPLTAMLPDGTEVSYAEMPDCAVPALTLAERTDRPGGVTFSLRLLRSADAPAALDAASLVAHLDGRPVEPAFVWDDAVTYTLDDLSPTKHHFTLRARDVAGRAVEPFGASFFAQSRAAEAPFRWDDAFIYQIVVDRFAAEEPFTDEQRARPLGRRVGGNLPGILKVLESGYFEALGVNTLWLSPLYDNPEDVRVGREGGPPKYVGYHGYWPAADRAVEPAFGTERDLDALVSAAHARGLRIIMDAVLNHLDATHPLARDRPEWFRQPACICGEAACPWSTHIEQCWFTPYLPDVDWRAPGALEHQIETARWWMERFDLDGLRLDAVPMMPRLVTRRMTAVTHAHFEGLRERHLLLGETYTGREGHDLIRWYLGPDGLDSQFDFPVMWTLREALGSETVPLTTLAEALTESARAWYGSTAVMAIMVGNHDVPRFVDAVTAPDADPLQRLRLAHGAVMSLPGLPILYYGDEIGLAGAYDPENRRPMRFAADRTPAEAALHDDVARLGRLRRCLPALRRGRLEDLTATADTIAWRRTLDDGRPAVFALNRGPTPARTVLPPAAGEPAPTGLAFGAGAADAAGRYELPPGSAALFLPAADPCLTEVARP
jgi:glycosidase